MRDPELIQVTKVEVEKYCGIKKIHLLKLRNWGMKGKTTDEKKMHIQMKELTKGWK